MSKGFEMLRINHDEIQPDVNIIDFFKARFAKDIDTLEKERDFHEVLTTGPDGEPGIATLHVDSLRNENIDKAQRAIVEASWAVTYALTTPQPQIQVKSETTE